MYVHKTSACNTFEIDSCREIRVAGTPVGDMYPSFNGKHSSSVHSNYRCMDSIASKIRCATNIPQIASFEKLF